MLIYEIIKHKQPEELAWLCKLFNIEEDSFVTAGEEVWFNPVWEMTHDSEGRYLNYSSRGHKVG
jgi:hypothetical protein